MGAIFYRQFAEGSKPYLTLAGEEYLRPLGIGSNWTTLKVAIQCAVTPNGVGNISNVNYAFGLCSGNRSVMSGNCANALLPCYAVNANYVYTSNGGQNFYYTAGAVQAAKVVNNVVTLGSGITATFGITGKRSVLLLTLVKGSPNYAASCSYVASAAGGNYANDQTFRHCVEWCDTTSIGGPAIVLDGVTTTFTGNGNNVAFDEVAGSLDTLNLYWNKTQFPLEIYGICIARQ